MFKWLLVHIGCIVAAAITSLYLTGYQQQQAAIAFWGDQYRPHEREENVKIDWGFIGNIMIPQGGPLISTEVIQSCSDTPLPMVPMRVEPDGDLYLLCGIGFRTYETLFDLNSVENEEFRNSLKDAIRQFNLSK
ncbi:TPA: hypothetical protein I8273_004724 [Aeromonas hydrophila]|nr:hypothetical protein [Aeromonas hydrophila]HAT2639180.1 hypothetical protein [Aeromonas hydrophila]HAT3424428.1 hypothetical protein [Aeromonas hydrophila]HAT3534362.1 hypothetical protein [Aeromonas hydrophila]